MSSINIIPQYKNIELKSIENNCCFSFEIIHILCHQCNMYQGLGQMLTKRLRHHQGYSETPKCAYVIYGQPLIDYRLYFIYAYFSGGSIGVPNHSCIWSLKNQDLLSQALVQKRKLYRVITHMMCFQGIGTKAEMKRIFFV